MTQREFCDLYPSLFHTSLTTDIDSFFRHGILSSQDIHREFSVPEEVVRLRRDDCATVTTSASSQFILRDQKPLKEAFFDRALEPGATREQWLQILNRHTFYFLEVSELRKLLGARSYLQRAKLVIELDSRSVIAEAFARCKISYINVGAAMFPNTPKRGENALVPLQRYLDSGSAKVPREFLIDGSLRHLLRHHTRHIILQPGATM